MQEHHIVISKSYQRISLINRAKELGNVLKACREYGVSRTYFYRWKKYFDGTQKSLHNHPRGPKISPRRTSKKMERKVLKIRSTTHYGARRIQYELKLEGIELGLKAISNILKRSGVTKSYHKRRYRSKSKHYAPYPGYEVQIDVMEIGKRKTREHCYQFTAIDTHTKMRYLKIYDSMSTFATVEFLKEVLEFFPFKVKRISTDNAPIFTYVLDRGQMKRSVKRMKIHPFTKTCMEHGVEHRLIRPGCPRMNCYVERSHRTDRQEWWWQHKNQPIDVMKKLVKQWQDIYNTLRPHSSLYYQTPLQYFFSLHPSSS